MSQKLDTESLKHWKENVQNKNGNEMFKWQEMKGFLESIFLTPELIALLQHLQEKSYNHISHIT